MSYPTQPVETQPVEDAQTAHPAEPEHPDSATASVPPPSALPGAREMPAGKATNDAALEGAADSADETRADSWGEPTGGAHAADLPERDPTPAPTTYASAASSANGAASSQRLWGDGTADRFRDRFREIQIRFVDEPAVATGEARDLVTDVFQELWDTLAARKAEIDAWEGGDRDNTEHLRKAVQSYRELVDDVLSR